MEKNMPTYLKYTVLHWFLMKTFLNIGTHVSTTNKTDRHDIAKILLKMALNTMTLTLQTMIYH
jgi:hypothetical protein